jgi:hypothetical protein
MATLISPPKAPTGLTWDVWILIAAVLLLILTLAALLVR